MRRLVERAVVVSLAPLGLALAALGVREATRAHLRPEVSHGSATEFLPPPMFLIATAAPGVDQALQVDGVRSSARVTNGVGGSNEREQRLRATGTLRILADETLTDLELDLAPKAGARSNGWPRDMELHLRGAAVRSRATAVPGVRSCSLRCSAVIGGTARDVVLSVAWMRLPGGTVELQAVATLEWALFDLPRSWSGWMLPGDAHCVLGLDLSLHAAP